MSDGVLVGVVGGYGAVGAAVVRGLRRMGSGLPGGAPPRLRIGGRDAARAQSLLRQECGPSDEAMAVDVFDPAALDRFCAGCHVVVNASAASYLVVDRVAQAALRAGADYVDAGGDRPLYDTLSAMGPIPGRALVTAGMLPGLSGLLPRWLATLGVATPQRLVAYTGVVDRLTPAGAVDYLLSLKDREAESQAYWLGGRKVGRAAIPEADAAVPFFPPGVTLHPYLGYEAQRLAIGLGLDEVRWHTVFDGGGNMMAALSRLQGAMSGHSDVHAAARELATAAELDMFGRDPYQLMVCELSGLDGHGEPAVRTAVVRSHDTSLLTGTVCALAVGQVLGGRVPPGVHFAAEGLDPVAIADALPATGAVAAFDVYDVPAADAGAVVEGVL